MLREYLYDRPGIPGAAGSVWLADRERSPLDALTEDLTCDIVVVGAGVTGVLTAIRLAEAGSDVVLLEGRRICSDVSGHTTAKATAQHGLVTRRLASDAREAWLRENLRAVERIERLAGRVGPEARFGRAASVVYTTRTDEVDDLRRELALYEDLGVPAEFVADGLPPGAVAAVRLDRQALLDPVGLCDGLLAGRPAQLRVYEGSMVRTADEDREGVTVRTDGGSVHAGSLVVATHVPFFDTLMYATRLFQYRTYALEIVVDEPPPDGMWYSEDEPHLSWRPYDSTELRRLVVSGVRHKAGASGDEREHYLALERVARERLGALDVRRHWSTQDASTSDHLPMIGKMIGRDHCFVATGYNGWGITSSEVAAEVLSALVRGAEHPLADLVAPLRFEAVGFATLAAENADVVAKAISHEVFSEGRPAELAPGEGRVMRAGGKHVAAIRDADGALHASDAHCAHLRCAVEFNEAEGTWDCPCHGSRYYGDGSWLHGPAKRGLDTAQVEDA